MRGERFASYRSGPENPGFTALLAPENRVLTRATRADGLALWIGHGSVNGVAFGTEAKPDEESDVLAKIAPDLAAFRERYTQQIGRIIPTETMARRGSHSIGFQQICEWRSPDDTLLLTDVRTIRVLPGPAEGRILDILLELRAPEEMAVLLEPSQDSLVQIQVASPLFPNGGGQLRNRNGDYGVEAMHGKGAAWCAAIGVVNGQTVGIVMLDHPANPGHPSPWIVREEGILSPSPFGWSRLELAPNESLALRYRLLIHEGYVDQGWADARMSDWLRDG